MNTPTSWDAFLSQPWRAPLLVVIAILLVFAVADWVEGRGDGGSRESQLPPTAPEPTLVRVNRRCKSLCCMGLGPWN